MARKVVDITRSANKYDLLSQTPENYSKDNYFLKELQEKVNADWEYRPNRALIEYEDQWGELTFKPLDVVIDSVLSEKGTAISSDTRNIIFKNISETRFTIGNRFRFSKLYDISADPADKDVWITINENKAKFTASNIIHRCNGTLGSIVKDEQGVSHYHYEPVIQGMDLSSVSIFYNETAVSPQSQLLVIAQHNEYTKKYFINQRFIVGYDKVYRVKAINKFYANSTNNPTNVGVMRIYLELTEASPYDDFVNRIAYQSDETIHIDPVVPGNCSVIFTSPDFIPTDLKSTPITFQPIVVDDNGVQYPDVTITSSGTLMNLPVGVNPDVYFELTPLENNAFSLKRNRIYLNGDLEIKCSVSKEDSPSGEPIEIKFTMVVRRQ